MKNYIFLVLVFLTACATDKKAAIKLSEQGLYEAALPKWIAAYKRDPDDVEVQVGLKICQEKVVNDRLVFIRDLRLAQNYEEAIAKLKILVDAQAEWKVNLDFNTSTFQGKELEALWSYERSKLIKFANEERSLAAEMRMKRISHIFKAMNDYDSVKAGVTQSGQRQCSKLKQHPKSMPYYSSYVSQYCLYFKPDLKKKEAKTSAVLFSVAESKLAIDGVNAELTSVMRDSLAKGFQTTPWFHADANRMVNVNLKGQYTSMPNATSIPQVYSYTVQVPYTDYESVKKTRQVPYDSTYRDCEFDTTANREVCRTRLITKYRKEEYWESEPVTRFRDDPREFHYRATKKTQKIALQLAGDILMDGKKLSFAFTKDVNEEKILHDMNLPDIGLRPAKDDITPPAEMFAQLSKQVGSELAKELNQFWISKYCAMPNARDQVVIGENVLRCRKAKDFPLAFVDSWFENTQNLKSAEVEELLGQF